MGSLGKDRVHAWMMQREVGGYSIEKGMKGEGEGWAMRLTLANDLFLQGFLLQGSSCRGESGSPNFGPGRGFTDFHESFQ